MAIFSYYTSGVPSGGYITPAEGDTIYVAPNVVVSTGDAHGIYGIGDADLKVWLQGTLVGYLGAYIGDATKQGATVRIDKDGQLIGLTATGLVSDGYSQKIDNSGLIHGYTHGIVMDSSDFNGPLPEGSRSVLNNFGIIEADTGVGIYLGTGADDRYEINNSGIIQGAEAAFKQLYIGSKVTITNKGMMDGAIVFSTLGDKYDGQQGHHKNGSIDGGAGNDTLWAGSDNDTIAGGDQNDSIRGNAGDDQLNGGKGADSIDGGTGNDYLVGSSHADVLSGGDGNDRLDGGADKDRLTGGLGVDQFLFTVTPDSALPDTITDFKHGEDKIVFDDAVFVALGTSIGSSEFLAAAGGHAATNSAQHLIYDNSTGELWFDSNGNGNGHASLVARLGTVASHPTNLTYTDFGIV